MNPLLLKGASYRLVKASRPAAAFLACIYFTFHCLAVAVWNLPVASYLSDQIVDYLEGYRYYIRHFQSWTTFITAPYIHSYSIKVEAMDSKGERRTYGPIIPGLRLYDNHMRTNIFFINVGTEGHTGYFEKYAQRLCKAIINSEINSFIPESITLLVNYSTIRALRDIQSDGVIAEPRTYSYGAYPCS